MNTLITPTPTCETKKRRWDRPWTLILALVVLASVALTTHWVFLVPIYQAPDEPTHLDYAMCISEAGRLFRAKEMLPREKWNGQPFPTYMTHPNTDYLMNRTKFRYLLNVAAYAEAGYGTPEYYQSLNADAPKTDSITVPYAPSLTSIYPYGYYALLATWISAIKIWAHSLTTIFFGARLLSVLLMGTGLVIGYLICRELNYSRSWSVALTAAMGTFPLTTFVASYIQPDNLTSLLTLLCCYLALRLKREKNQPVLLVFLGAGLGALLVTKLHVFLAVAAAIAAMLATQWLAERRTPKQWLSAAALVVLPALLFAIPQWWIAQGVENPYKVHPLTVTSVSQGLERFQHAVVDFYVSTTHLSFWGEFGWANTPLRIGGARETALFRFVTLMASMLLLGLTLLRFEQITSRLARVCAHGKWRTSLRIACSNPLVNSYFLFTLLMFAIYVRIDNQFAPQGRNWFAMLLPIFIVGLIYAPGALTLPSARRGLSWTLLFGLLGFNLLAAYYGQKTICTRYYEPVATIPVVEKKIAVESDDPVQMTWNGTEGDITGTSPCLPIVLDSPRYVHGIRMKCLLTSPEPGWGDYSIHWALKTKTEELTNQGSKQFAMIPMGTEQVISVFPRKVIDSLSIYPDRKRGHVVIKELILIESPVADEYNTPRRPINMVHAHVQQWLCPLVITTGVEVSQTFQAKRDGLEGIELQTVTWHNRPASYEVGWTLHEVLADGSASEPLRSGTVSSTNAGDWTFLTISFPTIDGTAGKTYSLHLKADHAPPANLLGVPIYQSNEPHGVLRVVDQSGASSLPPEARNGCLNMRLLHTRR